MMGYIDDGTLKHPLDWGTDRLIAHIRRLFVNCRKLNVYLHPEKFYPFSTEIDSLGIKRTLLGSTITENTQKKF